VLLITIWYLSVAIVLSVFLITIWYLSVAIVLSTERYQMAR
jgi:hypothetical protein